MGCDHCKDLFTTLESLQTSSPGRDKMTSEPSDEEKDGLQEQLRHLELELAQTKLQLVEAKCRIQVRQNSADFKSGALWCPLEAKVQIAIP